MEPDSSPPSALAARLKPWLEPLVVLAGIYAVHFVLVRTALDTGVKLPAARPFRAVPAFIVEGWDGIHYLHLAQSFDGYAWPPLYPMTLRLVGLVVPERYGLVGAALWVNLLAHVAIVFLAYALVRGSPRLREVPAWLFAALLLAFPGHNVFFAVYSESLYLALTLGVVVLWQRDRVLLAALLCGVALLARNMGMYLGSALVLAELWRAYERRQLSVRRLLASAAWLPFLVGWVLWLRWIPGTDPVAATSGWHEERLQKHVPAGENPKWWTFRYLAFSTHRQAVFFWACIVVAGFAWWKKWRLEALYMGLFLVSFGVYLYRPFPFSRYASVLFPLALTAAYALRRFPAAQAVAVAVATALAFRTEVFLFTDRWGEP